MWKLFHRLVIGVLVASSFALLSVQLILPANPNLYFSVMPNQGWGKVRGYDVIRDGSTIIFASGEVLVVHQLPGDGYIRPKNWRGIAWGSAERMSRRIFTNKCYRVSFVQFEAIHAAILSAIYPTIFFIRNFRRRRLHRDALRPCGQCGYDLQGNESGTCPECGTAIPLRTNTEVAG